MLGGLSFMEVLVILVVVLLLFGSHRVVDLARSLGEAVREFKRGMREIESSAPSAPPSAAQIAMHPPAPPASEAHGSHH